MTQPRTPALPTFTPRTSIREQLADALRSAIVSGEMQPGELYSAPGLAAWFGVSATPVREAMLDLVKQGLVEVVRNKGFKVTHTSDEDLDHITQIRVLLEPPAAAQAVENMTADVLDELRVLATTIVEAAIGADLIEYISADRQFHSRLLSQTGNDRLVQIVDDLRVQTRLYGLAALAETGRLADSAREHVRMCELIAAGDSVKLSELMRAHVTHVRGEWAG